MFYILVYSSKSAVVYIEMYVEWTVYIYIPSEQYFIEFYPVMKAELNKHVYCP